MKRNIISVFVALAFVSVAVAAAVVLKTDSSRQRSQPENDLVVHEWGTFLAMQGSDGVTLDGMYHEEHALPGFVHARSRDQLRLPTVMLKGETPVIYFYTSRRQPVGVSVGFAQGIWTQWYPQASWAAPELAAAASPPKLRDGRIGWSIELIPERFAGPATRLPATPPDSLWNFARDVDAVRVRAVDHTKKPAKSETERFLFYRGLGQAPLPMEATHRDGGTLSAAQNLAGDLQHVFVVRVEQGRGTYNYLPALHPGQSRSAIIPAMDNALPIDAFTSRISGELAARLAECGLYPKEARAMVNTWRSSYFHSDGIRVLFVLPQRWTDELIPLQIAPRPKELVRVMVGRLEVLTPERERLVERAVAELASPDSAIRQAAFNRLRDQGRYAEPIIRRVQRTTGESHVRGLCQRLLLTDFVTELRTAAAAAGNGERIREEPLFLRARLASLLREMGLDAEAQAEAAKVLPALQKMEPPPMTEDRARHYLRAHARTAEGMGDDRKAAEWYGKFVRFGSQIHGRREQCGACHQGSEGPHDIDWFQHWWAGERFASHAIRAGVADRLVAEQDELLRNAPQERDAAALMLAFLYDAKGDKSKAQDAWKRLGVSPPNHEPIASNPPATSVPK